MSNYFKTADGQEFYQECDAKNHAKTLEDKSVSQPINVAAIEVDAEFVNSLDESGTDEVGTDEGGTDEGGTDEAIKLNFSRFTKAQLVDFAKENELVIDETAINAAIVEEIEAQLIEKNQA